MFKIDNVIANFLLILDRIDKLSILTAKKISPIDLFETKTFVLFDGPLLFHNFYVQEKFRKVNGQMMWKFNLKIWKMSCAFFIWQILQIPKKVILSRPNTEQL